MDPRQHRVPSQQSSSFHGNQGGSSNGRRTLRDNGVPSLPYWQNKTPALLKADAGESFIDSRRSQRFKKGSTAGSVSERARSEVGELLANSGNRFNPAYNHRRDTSYHEDLSRAATRSVSYYERPRSSFEHASREPPAPLPVSSRVVRPRQNDWFEVERRSGNTGPPQGPFGSSEEEEDFSDVDEDDEAEMTAAYGYRGGRDYRRQRPMFNDDDIYTFGVIQLSKTRAREIVERNPPPNEFWDFTSFEKAAYLYYFALYKRYISSVKKFRNIFNREFYTHTAAGSSENDALLAICHQTRRDFNALQTRLNKQAYDRTQRHLFSDDRATPDSRASDRPSFCDRPDESDIASIDSSVKEPHRFTKPHAFVTFAVGGRLLVLNPEKSISTIRIEDVKSHIRNPSDLRNIEAMEEFKGPLIINETPSHTPLLFIENQIKRIMQSEIYRQNPASSDANDVLLIWKLLEILIKQHGNITGPDLARLLTGNYSYSSVPVKPVRGRADKEYLASLNTAGSVSSRSNSPFFGGQNDQRRVDPRAMDKFTQFLLNGYVDEAIESAIKDGMLFDALILAYRMFGNDRAKLDQIEARMLAFRDPQNPTLTLLSVASQMPVPILANMSSADDASSWRAHIAIVLANLNTPTAMYTVHQLGLALARKDFHSAADFCFLAVNLLTQHDCFEPVVDDTADGNEKPPRQHITLINASLPDDKYYSTQTRYGWSITDLQATEIYDFARKMSQRPGVQGPTTSSEYQRCRLDYAKMLAEYGGAATSAFKYCSSVAAAIWENAYRQPASMLNELCDLADRLHCAAAQTTAELAWVPELRRIAAHITNNDLNARNTQKVASIENQADGHGAPSGAQASNSVDSIGLTSSIEKDMLFATAPGGVPGFVTSTPVPSALPSVISTETPVVLPSQPQPPVHQQLPLIQQQPAPIQQVHQTEAPKPYQQGSNYDQQTTTHTTDHSRQTTASPTASIISNATFAGYGNTGFESGQQTGNAVNTPKASIDFGSYPDSRRESISIAQGTPSPPLVIPQQQQQNYQAQQHQQIHIPQHPLPPPQAVSPTIQVPAATTFARERSLSQSSNGTPLGSPKQAASFAPFTPTVTEHPKPPMQPQQPPIMQQIAAPVPPPAFTPEPIRQEPPPPLASAPAPIPVQQPLQSQPPQPANQQQSQQPLPNNQQPQQQQQQQGKKAGNSGGFLSGFKNKLVKMIPSGNEMILPDDSSPSIRWDSNLNRYVGEGIEEPVAPPPPPIVPLAAPTPGAGGAAPPPAAVGRAPLRRGAASRYANPFANTVSSSSGSPPSLAPEGMGMPPMGGAAVPPLPPTFGFIPAPMPDDDGSEAVDPFSSGGPSTEQPVQ